MGKKIALVVGAGVLAFIALFIALVIAVDRFILSPH